MIRIAFLLFLFAPEQVADLIDAIADSGRVVDMAAAPSDRLDPPLLVSPGAAPLLSFRYFDASDRGRFGNLGLMTDDAGH